MSKKPTVITLTAAAAAFLIVSTVLTACNGAASALSETGETAAAEFGGPAARETELAVPGSGWLAMQNAADEDKYLFTYFYKTEEQQTGPMRAVFDAAVHNAGDRANGVTVDVTDTAEKKIVGKFNVSRAPMPLVLALAPNGAVTGGFPAKFTEQQLLGAMVSPAAADCLGALQGGKLVFLCLQNEGTKFNGEAMAGVREFTKDSRFTEATEVITIDPTDPGEAQFLKNLEVETQVDSALTLFMAPPGAVLARYSGGTNKEEMAKTLTAALSKSGGCGPGSSPGCCPPKK